MTPAQGRRQRRALLKEIARDLRRQQRLELRGLVDAVRAARADRAAAYKNAREQCRSGRLEARERVAELRAKVRAELREAVAAWRAEARRVCDVGLAQARELGGRAERARAKLAAEKQYRGELRRLETYNAKKSRALDRRRGVGRRERWTESDDEVRGNIPPELVPLFDRVKGQIKGSERMSRSETFMHYAHDNPKAVLEVYEDRSDALVAELEARERGARRALKKPIGRRELEAAAGDAPF